jgi:hypothetical protein
MALNFIGAAMTTRRADLIAAVGQVQNHPACVNQDIMTFCGFLSDDEIAAHLESNLARVARWSETQHKWKRKR